MMMTIMMGDQEEPALSSSWIIPSNRGATIPKHDDDNECEVFLRNGSTGMIYLGTILAIIASMTILAVILFLYYHFSQEQEQHHKHEQQQQALLELVEQRRLEIQAVRDEHQHQVQANQALSVQHQDERMATDAAYQADLALVREHFAAAPAQRAAELAHCHAAELAHCQARHDAQLAQVQAERQADQHDAKLQRWHQEREHAAVLQEARGERQELKEQLADKDVALAQQEVQTKRLQRQVGQLQIELQTETTQLTQQLNELVAAREQQAQNAVVCVQYDMVYSMAEYKERTASTKASSELSSLPLSTGRAMWYWAQDRHQMHLHDARNVWHGTNLVQYPARVSAALELAHRRYQAGTGGYCIRVELNDPQEQDAAENDTTLPQEGGGNKTASEAFTMVYRINFDTMTQENERTGFMRQIRRIDTDAAAAVLLPPVPEDIPLEEPLLQAHAGQVIQVTKLHANGLWKYGTVVYDPLMERPATLQEYELRTLLTTQPKPSSQTKREGWFPTTLAQTVSSDSIRDLVAAAGGGAVSPFRVPSRWKSSVSGKVALDPQSQEYTVVRDFFQSKLKNRNYYAVQSIYRIQNFGLWQEYCVQKDSLQKRDYGSNQRPWRVNNPGKLERVWLFHGTSETASKEIIQRGFDRSFAHKANHGKGVYFSFDSEYSAHLLFAPPNAAGLKHMFLCRVLVGDWCLGHPDQPRPDKKGPVSEDRFDSTVNSAVNPMTFATFHDGRAYPEYLVCFKEGS